MFLKGQHMFRCTFWLMPYPRRQRGNKTHCNIKEYKIIYLTKKDSAEGQESKLYSLLPSKKFVLLVKVTQNATKGSAEQFPVPIFESVVLWFFFLHSSPAI